MTGTITRLVLDKGFGVPCRAAPSLSSCGRARRSPSTGVTATRARAPKTSASSDEMAPRMPTQRGDVLILRTDKSFILHAVGRVTKDDRQDFDTHVNLQYENDRAAAVADAKALVGRGRRIFFRNLDTGERYELSD